jgi:hypothetical protein
MTNAPKSAHLYSATETITINQCHDLTNQICHKFSIIPRAILRLIERINETGKHKIKYTESGAIGIEIRRCCCTG